MSKPLPIVRHFYIKLDKIQLIYKAGDEVKGHCFLYVDGILQLKNLDINLICEGYVDYKENWNRSDNEWKYENRFLFHYSDVSLFLTFTDVSPVFSPLRKGFPSSFTGKFGFIRYKIEAIIHKDWDSFRKEIIFAVIAPFNGFSTEIFKPITRSTQRKVGFQSDFIELYAKLDKGWYTPGDKVSVYCNVNNNTDYKLKLILSLHLKQNYHFTKVKSRINNEESFDFIEPHLKCYSKRILLSIPSNLKTMSLESKLIGISYEIRVSLEMLGYKDSLKVELPVVITIPPNTSPNSNGGQNIAQLPPSYTDCQVFQHFASQDIEVCFPSVPYDKEIFHEKQPKSPKCVDLPPSYEEAVFGIDEVR